MKFFNVVTRLRCNSNSINKLPLASIALRKCEPIKNIHTRTHIVQQPERKKTHRKVTDEPSKRAEKKWRHYFVIKNGAWCIVSGVHFFRGCFYLLNVTCGRQRFHINADCVLCSRQSFINYFTALLYETGREREKSSHEHKPFIFTLYIRPNCRHFTRCAIQMSSKVNLFRSLSLFLSCPFLVHPRLASIFLNRIKKNFVTIEDNEIKSH